MVARLPEVKTWDDQARLLTIMEANDIWYARAGITYKNELQKYLYITSVLPADKQTIFPTISYGGDWIEGKWDSKWHNDDAVKKMAAKYFLTYKRWKGISVRMVDNKERENIEFIVCQKFPPKNSHQRHQEQGPLSSHRPQLCQRHMQHATCNMQHMTYAINKARTITNLNLNIMDRTPDNRTFFPDMEELEDTFNLVSLKWKTQSTSSELHQGRTTSPRPPGSFKRARKFSVGPKLNLTTTDESNREPELHPDRKPRSLQLSILMTNIGGLKLDRLKVQRLYQQEDQQHICQLTSNETQPNNMYNTYSFDAVMNNNYQTVFHCRKCALPLVPIILGGLTATAGANMIPSAVNGGAPMSWFGQTIGPLLGLWLKSGPKKRFDRNGKRNQKTKYQRHNLKNYNE